MTYHGRGEFVLKKQWNTAGSLQTFIFVILQKLVGQMPHQPHRMRRPCAQYKSTWFFMNADSHGWPAIVSTLMYPNKNFQKLEGYTLTDKHSIHVWQLGTHGK